MLKTRRKIAEFSYTTAQSGNPGSQDNVLNVTIRFILPKSMGIPQESPFWSQNIDKSMEYA